MDFTTASTSVPVSHYAVHAAGTAVQIKLDWPIPLGPAPDSIFVDALSQGKTAAANSKLWLVPSYWSVDMSCPTLDANGALFVSDYTAIPTITADATLVWCQGDVDVDADGNENAVVVIATSVHLFTNTYVGEKVRSLRPEKETLTIKTHLCYCSHVVVSSPFSFSHHLLVYARPLVYRPWKRTPCP